MWSIAFHAGDDPAQQEVVGIKCDCNFQHGCIWSMYNLEKMVYINVKLQSKWFVTSTKY